MGWLADRWPKKLVMLLIYSLIVIAIPLLFFASVPGIMYVFAAIFGLGLGGCGAGRVAARRLPQHAPAAVDQLLRPLFRNLGTEPVLDRLVADC